MKVKNYPRMMSEYNQVMKGKNYFKIIGEHKILIVVVTILVGVLAFVFSLVKPVTYDSLVTLSVSKVNREATADFQYDNYYAIQAAELLGNTVVSWFKTPDFISEVYERASLTPEADINKLTKRFKAKQASSHTVEVRINNRDRERTEQLATALIVVIQERIEGLEKNSTNEPSFSIAYSAPLVFERKYNPYLVGAIGLGCGLCLGIGLAFLLSYFRSEE